MKFSDLLRMSGSNLLRRKLRTALTVLGAVSYTHLDVYKRQYLYWSIML